MKAVVRVIDVANLFNVGGFAVFEFLRENGTPFEKDAFGRGYVNAVDIDLNAFADHLKRQEHTYRGEVHKMHYLYRDKAKYEEAKKCETDIERYYRVDDRTGTIYLVSKFRDHTCVVKKWHTKEQYYSTVGYWASVHDLPKYF